jgi:uncharacterized OB-fold protein
MYKNSPIAAWRNQKSAYRLEGVSCDACGALFFPRKYRCNCSGRHFSPFQFSGNAVLLSFTQVSIPSIEFIDYSPYCIGLVRLEEGPTVLMQLTDVAFEELSPGMPMIAVFRRYFAAGNDGMIFYGIKFAPAELA